MKIQNDGTYWTIALSKAESIINISSTDIVEVKQLFMDRMSKKFDNAVVNRLNEVKYQ